MEGWLLGFYTILFGPIMIMAILGAALGAVFSQKGKKKRWIMNGFVVGFLVGSQIWALFVFAPSDSRKDIPMVVDEYGSRSSN